MTIKKTTNVNYDKVIGGQNVSFGYNYGEQAPEQISVNIPLFVADFESKAQLANGNMSVSINVLKKEDAKGEILAMINAAFAELDNVITNYQNPEGV